MNIPTGAYAIHAGESFASLGLNPGTYHYSWGAGPDQRLTFQVGTTIFVPEPTTLLTLGAAGFALIFRRRRRRFA